MMRRPSLTWRFAPTSRTARDTFPPSPTSSPYSRSLRMESIATGVMQILTDGGIGLPAYYEWRTRSGCYFCFYQRKAEWIGLADRHPDLFDRAVAIERKVLRDAGVDGDADFGGRAMRGRQYTWSHGETLPVLLARRDDIQKRHDAAMSRARSTRGNLRLMEALAEALDEDDDTRPCTVCSP